MPLNDKSLVISLLEKTPIDQYCREQQLTIKQRLKLFLNVCDAIEYAHRNMVVHRDIKPAYILVDENADIKLLDFGIAKIMDESNPSADITQAVSRPMTRNYSSPEMLRGETIDVTSDVYSLGVLLYELLTDHKPYEYVDSAAKLEKAVMNDEVKKPSSVASKNISKKLSGDLDTIIIKAMKKSPLERYSSVENFADDINRHLSGHVVTAQPDSVIYHMKKFIYRHRIMVSFASFAVATLIMITTMAINYAITTAEQSKKITKERNKAESIKSFFVDVFVASDPTMETSKLSALEIVERGYERVDDLKEQPEVKAELLSTFAHIFRSYRMSTKSIPAQKASLKLIQEIYGERSTEYVNALLRTAETFDISGDNSRSIKYAKQAVSFGKLINDQEKVAHG